MSHSPYAGQLREPPGGAHGHLPTLDKVPPEMQMVIKKLRARPDGEFIQRLYNEHRARSAV